MSNKYFLLFLISAFLIQCKEGVEAPDVSNIKSDVKIHRFDQSFRDLDTLSMENALAELQNNYPELYPLFFEHVLVLKTEEESDLKVLVNAYLNDKRIKDLHSLVDSKYSNIKDYEADLNQACKYLLHYIPDLDIPNFYTVVSEYGIQNFIFGDGEKDGIGIGLDMFLGNDYPYQKLDPANPSFSNYMTRTYNKEHLVKKTLDPLINELVGRSNGKRLLDKMIHYGKRSYIMDRVLPTTHDTVILEYSDKQLQWLLNNELEIWSYFLEKKLLMETSHLQINKYLEPAPKSPGMPAEAPGRTAVFIGKQIVERYMERNPNLGIPDLIKEFDSQKILKEAKYKPSRR